MDRSPRLSVRVRKLEWRKVSHKASRIKPKHKYTKLNEKYLVCSMFTKRWEHDGPIKQQGLFLIPPTMRNLNKTLQLNYPAVHHYIMLFASNSHL